ncbi:MAG: hypothetical protein LBK75_09475 [Oscillospiraceae bacterium]|jgi:hypothetical protein|nr:hypothetical protein [Oscillospiraceae bacterium]
MKKLLCLLLAGALLALSAAPSALAAHYTNRADELSDLGLFLGTGVGYALDRAPTRAEAAAILVRLLGKETDALAGVYTHPFEDVPTWADDYVGYLFSHQLTNGVSATRFAPGDVCSAQMFAAFILRALGYSEAAGDFTYSGVLAFAEDLTLVDGRLLRDEFWRDQAVAAMYNALFTRRKGTSATLLETLADEGAISADAAAALLDKAARLRALNAAISADPVMRTDAAALNLEASITVTDSTPLSPSSEKIFSSGVSRWIYRAGQLEMENRLTVHLGESDPAAYETAYYIKDGFLYLDTDGTRTYTSQDLSALSPAQPEMWRLQARSYLVDDIVRTSAPEGTRYTYATQAFSLDRQFALTLQALDIDIDTASFDAWSELLFAPNGALRAITTGVTVYADNLTASFSGTQTITAYGSDVVVDFPDFTNWGEFVPDLDPDTALPLA